MQVFDGNNNLLQTLDGTLDELKEKKREIEQNTSDSTNKPTVRLGHLPQVKDEIEVNNLIFVVTKTMPRGRFQAKIKQPGD